MNKGGVFVLLFFLLGLAPPENCLVWNASRKLQWKDFEGKQPTNANYAAEPYCFVNYTLAPKGDSFIITINACFDKYQSWCILEDTNARLMKHEQIHWDIAELQARKFREQVFNWDRKEFIKDFLAQGIKNVEDSLSVMQTLYDRETIHGLYDVAQLRWQRKIDSLIGVYEPFSCRKIALHK